ncbi:hypothetical protein E2605_07805 [Dysgonomonas capnocytophagoides]|uniref:Uncharacterized protein n=1 Tax=Dysgonomonas capnocytophagoides TaxID=45254 RepID=A0A4Y8L879_9BACT|nr:hypothetical protein [Dysgonomonas capnocytophagoides]TFD96716.1 hypothetical protein E2605_07805 [Dysgonomonas capnocytophagoides]
MGLIIERKMKEIKQGDFIKFISKSQIRPNIEYAMILDIYDLFDGGKGIHHCTPRTEDQVNSLMNQSWTPISQIKEYEHFESLEAIKKDMRNTGYVK